MGHKKKNKLLLIIIILLIILILLVGIGIVYFTTDIFKGNKQLFFKYASQMVDEKEGLINSQLVNYFDKQQNTPYKTDGYIAVEITPDDVQYENVNDMYLVFSGQVDIANSKSEQNIILNYSDEVNFPLIYRQIGKTIGIQTDYIGSKFISTDSLGKALSEVSNTDQLEQVQDLSNISFSEEELEHIKGTYLGVLNEQLKESNFSKLKDNNRQGYKLTLNLSDYKNILLALLQTLRSDQVTLAKLNECGENITTSDIDRIIQSVEQEQNNEDAKTELIIYQENNKFSGIEIKENDETIIQITKKNENDQLEYDIELQAGIKIGLNIKYNGLQTMETVDENYTLSLGMEENTYQYNYTNKVEFIDNSTIENFNGENALNLDTLEEEQKNTLMQAIGQRLQDVNTEQMEQLGLKAVENPLQYIIPSSGVYSNSLNALNVENDMSEMEISAFNSKFEMYGGTNIRGTTVRGLITIIASNNGLDDEEDENNENSSSLFSNNNENDNLIEEIHFDGSEYEVNKQNITLIKSSIETESYYRVEFEKEENTGRIYRVVINKK